MAVSTYEELKTHVGHEVEVVTYSNMNAAIECITCGMVLVDFNADDDERIQS